MPKHDERLKYQSWSSGRGDRGRQLPSYFRARQRVFRRNKGAAGKQLRWRFVYSWAVAATTSNSTGAGHYRTDGRLPQTVSAAAEPSAGNCGGGHGGGETPVTVADGFICRTGVRRRLRRKASATATFDICDRGEEAAMLQPRWRHYAPSSSTYALLPERGAVFRPFRTEGGPSVRWNRRPMVFVERRMF